MISGARYHLVATYSVMYPSILLRIYAEASCQPKVPQSSARSRHFTSKLPGFKSRCNTLGAVDVFKPAQNLVDERLEMGVGQRLARPDDGCQIALHEFYIEI